MKATGRNDSSSTYRNAIHTHGQQTIGTEKIASSCQHSSYVAKKHYLHKTQESSAFPQFFEMVKNTEEEEKKAQKKIL